MKHSSDNSFLNPFLPSTTGSLAVYAMRKRIHWTCIWTRRVCPGTIQRTTRQELFIKFDIRTGKEAGCRSVTNTFLYGYTSDSRGQPVFAGRLERGCQGRMTGVTFRYPSRGAESYYVARMGTSFRPEWRVYDTGSNSSPRCL